MLTGANLSLSGSSRRDSMPEPEHHDTEQESTLEPGG